MSDVAPEVTKQLIERQLFMWRNTLEDNRIAAKVADAIADLADIVQPLAILAGIANPDGSVK